MRPVVLTAWCGLSLMQPCAAATFFSHDFVGPLTPHLEDPDGAWVTGAGSAYPLGGRAYLRTAEADYIDVDFVAELVYRQTTGGGPAGVFFGAGAALRNPNFYDEPYPAVFSVDHASDYLYRGINIRRWTSAGSEVLLEDVAFYDESLVYSGVAIARIIRNGDQLVMQADLAHDGTFVTPSYSVALPLGQFCWFLDDSNTRLFFGTDESPTRFLSFEVRPLPVCTGDVNGDLVVDFGDLDALLQRWGDVAGPDDPIDIDGNGVIDFGDLNELLDHWGDVC